MLTSIKGRLHGLRLAKDSSDASPQLVHQRPLSLNQEIKYFGQKSYVYLAIKLDFGNLALETMIPRGLKKLRRSGSYLEPFASVALHRMSVSLHQFSHRTRLHRLHASCSKSRERLIIVADLENESRARFEI